MLSRAEQIDVLRYWEEIELLTPPDYRVVENERLLVCEWKSGRPAGRDCEVAEGTLARTLRVSRTRPSRRGDGHDARFYGLCRHSAQRGCLSAAH